MKPIVVLMLAALLLSVASVAIAENGDRHGDDVFTKRCCCWEEGSTYRACRCSDPWDLLGEPQLPHGPLYLKLGTVSTPFAAAFADEPDPPDPPTTEPPAPPDPPDPG